MKKLFSLLLLAVIIFPLFLSLHFAKPVSADQVTDLMNQILEYEKQVNELNKQANSLSQQIGLMDKQIQINTLKIKQTENQIIVLEKEIDALSGKIIRLDGSLNQLSKALLSRVSETYKRGKINSFALFLSSKSFSDFIKNFRFLQAVQIHDRQMLVVMEQTRTSYDEQKQLKEKKQVDLEKLQKQLEAQKKDLNVQIADRKRLFDETKGKEANYQKLLASARAELEAILGILQGKGTEREIKKVSEGERIASMIAGESCNSSGTHLHFIVTKGSDTLNPLSYLKSVDYQNCSGSSCGGGDGDPFNPSGDWDWPLSPKIGFNQGYGSTWAIAHTWVGKIYKFHNGIDIESSNLEVKAVKPGTLFLGSIAGNCVLKYVRLHHDEGDFDTYYLHVNY